MSLQRQVAFWLVALAVLVLGLYLLREILLPFVAGLAIAYFLDPLADWLEERGVSRLIATLLITVFFSLVFLLFLIVLVPVLGQQLAEFAQRLPGYLGQLQITFATLSDGWLMKALGMEDGKLPFSAGEIVSRAASWAGTLAQSVITGGVALVSFLSLFIVTPVVAFYMLYDWDRMVARVDNWLPRDHLHTIRGLASEIDRAMAGFVRGQGSVCLILGIFYAAALTLAGLNFGLLIGLLAGLISFIPYVGSTVGLVVAGGVAVVQFWPDWTMVALIVGIFFAGQAVEGNYLQPKLVGDSVGLHPVWIMFALFAFAYLFGFVGMLLAVPLAAAASVLLRFALRQYMASPLYRGGQGGKNTDG